MEAIVPNWDLALPVPDRKAALTTDLVRWVNQPCLRALAHSFGESLHGDLGSPALYAAYERISEAHWDLRKGVERNMAATAHFTASQEDAIRDAVDCLGLAQPSKPVRNHFDYTVILGGLIRACVTRPRYASRIASSGVTSAQTLALGGFRPLGGNEIEIASALGISAENEFTAMVEGVKMAYPGSGDVTLETSALEVPHNDDYAIASFSHSDVLVVAAPSSEPERRRANTADTFAWWASRDEGWSGKTVLVITNPIYVPYQSAAVIQTLALPFGADVEVVGIDAAAADLGTYTQVFGIGNYVQEIRSSILSYKALLEVVSNLE
jgi:hypothetical protein